MSNHDNTKKFILIKLLEHGRMTAMAIVKKRWPSSKQPRKKACTITNHCEELRKQGIVEPETTDVHYFWKLTSAGRMEAHEIKMSIARRRF